MAQMATLVVTTVPSIFPAGTEAGEWRFSVSGLGDNTFFEELLSAASTGRFGPLEAGDYIAHAVRLSVTGELLGVEVGAEFSIAEDEQTITIDTAGGLRVRAK